MTEELEISTKINIQLDSQILSAFMKCPAYCDYTYNRHLASIKGKPKHYEKGSLMHWAIKCYYDYQIANGIYNKPEAYKYAANELVRKAPTFTNIPADEVLECMRVFEQWAEFKFNESWIPLATEKTFKVLGYEDDLMRVILTGKIDLIMESPNGEFIIPFDHKTETERWFHSSLYNQYRIYCIATKAPFLVVNRVGFQTSLKPQDKFKQETINQDTEALEEFRTITLPHYCRELYLCLNGEQPWIRNHTSCISGHFACTYSDKKEKICSESPSLREEKIARFFVVKDEWNPENED